MWVRYLMLSLWLLAGSATALDKPLASTEWLAFDQQPVYWDEYYFWLRYSSRFYKSRHQLEHIDWSQQEDNKPLEQYFRDQASQYACEQRAILKQAAATGIEYTAGDIQALQQLREQNIKTYGGEIEYQRLLKRMYISEPVYNQLSRVDTLSSRLFEQLYGKDATSLNDQAVMDYVANHHLIHHSWLFVDKQQGEAGHQRLQQQWQALHQQASPATALLKNLRQFGDDGVMKPYPDGRLLAAESMAPWMTSALLALPAGQISPLIETDNGWYVLARLPITATTRVNNSNRSVRYQAAWNDHFRPTVAGWCQQLPVHYSDGYGQLPLSGILR